MVHGLLPGGSRRLMGRTAPALTCMPDDWTPAAEEAFFGRVVGFFHHNDWTGMSLKGRLWLQLVEWHSGQRGRNAAVLDG